MVIGTWTAAMTAAMQVRSAGWQVAVIDYRPFGGTCALRGCDPKKTLIGGADALDHSRRMHGKGVMGDVHIDWQQLMAFKRTFTDPVPQKMEQRYKEKGIDSYHGKARFVGKNAVQVEGKVLEAKHVIVASGAEPVKLNIPREEYLMDNEGFLALETVLIDEQTDYIVGAHLVGPNVEEGINVFALAMRHGLTANNLRTTMFAYPTGASDISSML